MPTARRGSVFKAPAGPGPGQYDTRSGKEHVKDTAPAFTMAGKRANSHEGLTPGPASYSSHLSSPAVQRRAPAFSFGSGRSPSPPPKSGRSSPLKLSNSTDGSVFRQGSSNSGSQLPVIPRAKSFPHSINDRASLSQTTFDIVDPLNSTKRRAPRYSMGRRLSNSSSMPSSVPGPAAYNPPVASSSPAYTLGSKSDPASAEDKSLRKRHTLGVLRLPAVRDATPS